MLLKSRALSIIKSKIYGITIPLLKGQRLKHLILILTVPLLVFIGFKFFNSPSNKINSDTSFGLNAFQSKSFETNNFRFVISKASWASLHKPGGVVKTANKYEFYEQEDLSDLFRRFGIENTILDASPDPKEEMKRLFKYNDDYFVLAVLRKKTTNCRELSFINLSKGIEIFRGTCIPWTNELDFNGSGGGHTEWNNGILLGIGTPTTDYDNTSNLAQDDSSLYGKIIYLSSDDLTRSLSSEQLQERVFAKGLRNPQGLFKLGNTIYEVEHGPKGGDELNIIERNANYGWPLFSFGAKYATGIPYTNHKSAVDFKIPIYSWLPSIGVSNLTRCPSVIADQYKEFDCLLVSSLRAESMFIVIIERELQRVISVEQVNMGMRIRDFYRFDDDLLFSTDGFPVFKLSVEKIW